MVNNQTRLDRMRSMFPTWLSQASTTPLQGRRDGWIRNRGVFDWRISQDPDAGKGSQSPSPKTESVSGTGGKKS